MNRAKKSVTAPRRTKLADAVAAAATPAPETPVAEAPIVPRSHKDIVVDGDKTQLVRQFIMEQINALPPSQQAVMMATYKTFLNLVVVLAPEPTPDPKA